MGFKGHQNEQIKHNCKAVVAADFKACPSTPRVHLFNILCHSKSSSGILKQPELSDQWNDLLSQILPAEPTKNEAHWSVTPESPRGSSQSLLGVAVTITQHSGLFMAACAFMPVTPQFHSWVPLNVS